MLWDEPKIFFLERRYFFSIILSEFLKNRVALQQEKPPWGVCVTKNASHAANVRAYGACAAAACNPKSKKAAFAAFF